MAVPFVPFPGVVQVSMRLSEAGQQVENVLNFDIGGLDFNSACATINASLAGTLWPGLQPFLHTSVSHVENYYVDLTTETGPTATFGPFASPNGTGAAPALPNNVAFCVTHRTLGRGRSYRGRTYVGGLTTDDAVGSYIGSGVAASIVAAYNDMRTELEGEDILFVVASRRINKTWRVLGQATPITISIARDLVLDSQRRRSPGRGA